MLNRYSRAVPPDARSFPAAQSKGLNLLINLRHLPLLQGLAEIARCVICLRQGAWPRREDDVEEVDVEKLKQMVHIEGTMYEASQPTSTPGQQGGKP